MMHLSVIVLLVFLLGDDGGVQGAVTSAATTYKPTPTKGCVDNKRKEVETCMNTLKADLASKKSTDVYNFLCGPTQKERLDCVIKNFRECPDFIAEDFLKALNHTPTKLYAEELFLIQSADEFCKCVPTHRCLSEINFEQMSVELELKYEHPWKAIANPAYICGLGRSGIDCVRHALPVCTQYLQHKHNKTVQDPKVKSTWFRVSDIEYAYNFANRWCKLWPKDNHTCTEKRVRWQSLAACYDGAENIKDAEERKCGMRKCIEIDMSTCPPGDMNYFIDAINVFSENKVKDTPCELSSATVTMATIATICTSQIMAMFVHY